MAVQYGIDRTSRTDTDGYDHALYVAATEVDAIKKQPRNLRQLILEKKKNFSSNKAKHQVAIAALEEQATAIKEKMQAVFVPADDTSDQLGTYLNLCKQLEQCTAERARLEDSIHKDWAEVQALRVQKRQVHLHAEECAERLSSITTARDELYIELAGIPREYRDLARVTTNMETWVTQVSIGREDVPGASMDFLPTGGTRGADKFRDQLLLLESRDMDFAAD